MRVVYREEAPVVVLTLALDAEQVLGRHAVAVGAALRVAGAKELDRLAVLAGDDAAALVRSLFPGVRDDLFDVRRVQCQHAGQSTPTFRRTLPPMGHPGA